MVSLFQFSFSQFSENEAQENIWLNLRAKNSETMQGMILFDIYKMLMFSIILSIPFSVLVIKLMTTCKNTQHYLQCCTDLWMYSFGFLKRVWFLTIWESQCMISQIQQSSPAYNVTISSPPFTVKRPLLFARYQILMCLNTVNKFCAWKIMGWILVHFGGKKDRTERPCGVEVVLNIWHWKDCVFALNPYSCQCLPQNTMRL